MIRLAARIASVAIALAVATIPCAFAHEGHNEMLRIDVEKNVVRLSFSLDGDQLLAFDGDLDGKLSKQEYTAAVDAMSAWIDEKIAFVGRDHVRGKPVFSDLPITGFDELADTDEVEHVRVLRSYPIGEGTSEMMLRFNLFHDARSSRHFVVWNGGTVSEGVLTPESNVVTLGPAD